MERHNPDASCQRNPKSRELMLGDAGFDETEEQVLSLIRFYFQTIANPAGQAWMSGLDLAEAMFGDTLGPMVAMRSLDTLRGVRFARRSVFTFNSPTCPSCANLVTEHERRLIAALAFVRRGRIGHAKTELMMLCEGNETAYVIETMIRLSSLLPQPVEDLQHA